MVNPMDNLLKPQWWRDVKWDGCLAWPSNLQKLAAAESPGKLPADVGWYDYSVPTINQLGPSCCGQAWANWMEMMLRRYVGKDCLQPGEEIDGRAIWAKGRELFYGGAQTGGLYLGQGFAAMIALGMIPPKSQLLDVDPSIDAMAAQLQKTPMVQGHVVCEGWYHPNPENGCLDHSTRPGPGDGGHATCLMGLSVKNNTVFWVAQNSWGTDYGWKGYFLMTDSMWKTGYLGEGPCTAALPDGWEQFDGWKQYVTRNAQ
jgi:Papain family cysteine protease